MLHLVKRNSFCDRSFNTYLHPNTTEDINIMKKILTLVLLIGISSSLFADIFIRYNKVGYDPLRKKRVIVMSDRSIKNNNWSMVSSKGDTILKGTMGKHEFGMNDHLPKMFNYTIDFSKIKTEGDYTLSVKGAESVQISIKKGSYVFLTNQMLRFMRVQRSGSADCLDHKISHLGDASCKVYTRKNMNNKEWEESFGAGKVDMLGGWYDAGDYIKFTLTTAYTSYFMLRSYETNPEIYRNVKNFSKSKLNDMLDEVKWGLDYLMKCMPDTNTFIIQVADHMDHREGVRFPDQDRLDGQRKAYSCLSPTQMGYTAAALALGAKVFREEGLESEADKYEKMAKQVFRVAKRSNEIPAWFEFEWEKFYFDETPDDNMELGATELYYLTKDKSYLRDARMYADKAKAGYWASWGSCHLQAHTRLMKHHSTCLEYLEQDLKMFKSKTYNNGNIWGMPHDYTWATLYSFLCVGNGAIQHSATTNLSEYKQIALDVLDYTLGQNNWGMSMIASPDIPGSAENVYSQFYKLQKELFPIGAVAEGPGDRKTHDELKQYFNNDENTDPLSEFNTPLFVFYNNEHDFQCMETTICGMADAIFFITNCSKYIE